MQAVGRRLLSTSLLLWFLFVLGRVVSRLYGISFEHVLAVFCFPVVPTTFVVVHTGVQVHPNHPWPSSALGNCGRSCLGWGGGSGLAWCGRTRFCSCGLLLCALLSLPELFHHLQ